MQLGKIILLSLSKTVYALPSNKCEYSLDAFAKSSLILIIFAIDVPVSLPSVARSGNYITANCGADAEKVVNALKTLYSILLPAINNLIIVCERLSAAYLAFSKDISSAQIVRDVLNNVTTALHCRGQRKNRLDPGFDMPQSPTAR